MITAELHLTGHFIDASPQVPALALGLALRPAAIAPLLLELPAGRWSRPAADPSAIATGEAGLDLLDAVARLLRLLDQPADAPVLAPLTEREILWRLLTGPHGGMVRQIGLAGSGLSHVSRAIRWIRDNYAEPVRIPDLARQAGMSPSAFHRHFRAVTAMSPVQFQKCIRLQNARSLLVARPGDVAAVGHLVGYDSPPSSTASTAGCSASRPGRTPPGCARPSARGPRRRTLPALTRGQALERGRQTASRSSGPASGRNYPDQACGLAVFAPCTMSMPAIIVRPPGASSDSCFGLPASCSPMIILLLNRWPRTVIRPGIPITPPVSTNRRHRHRDNGITPERPSTEVRVKKPPSRIRKR